MQNEFSANSNVPAKDSKPQGERKEKPEVERVVTGEVILKKKPVTKKLKSWFFGSDSVSVWDYVLRDILVPAAKDTISDAVSGGIERLLFGEASGRRRRHSPMSPPGAPSRIYTNYGSYSRPYRGDDRPPFPPGNRQRRSHSMRETNNLDDILLATRAEAEDVIRRLSHLISEYDAATVSDLRAMLGLTKRYTDDNWGWFDLSNATVRHRSDGYLLLLPEPQPLD